MGNQTSQSLPFNPLTNLVDLKGKVIIVTGGNKGIGFATVEHLARTGAKVYLAARNESRATGALAKLEQQGLASNVVWLKLDLSDPRDAKAAAEEFMKREERLDILINNAALKTQPHVIGRDGVSDLAIVNYISPYVFTRTLLPLLQQTAKESGSDVRIVNVNSHAHKLTPSSAKFSDISDFNTNFGGPLSSLKRYGYTKLMMILWSKTLQTQLNSDPNASIITVISLHPGVVNTFTESLPFAPFFKWLGGFLLETPTVGAYTSVFAAASKTVFEDKALYRGVYLENRPPGKFAQPSKAALDTDLGNQLSMITESFLKKIGI